MNQFAITYPEPDSQTLPTVATIGRPNSDARKIFCAKAFSVTDQDWYPRAANSREMDWARDKTLNAIRRMSASKMQRLILALLRADTQHPDWSLVDEAERAGLNYLKRKGFEVANSGCSFTLNYTAPRTPGV